jgi:hypothetical protein
MTREQLEEIFFKTKKIQLFKFTDQFVVNNADPSDNDYCLKECYVHGVKAFKPEKLDNPDDDAYLLYLFDKDDNILISSSRVNSLPDDIVLPFDLVIYFALYFDDQTSGFDFSSFSVEDHTFDSTKNILTKNRKEFYMMCRENELSFKMLKEKSNPLRNE